MILQKKNDNRKVLLINPRFQKSYIMHILTIMLVMVSIFYASNLYHFWEFKKKGLEAGLPSEHIFFQFLNEQQSSLDIAFLVTAIAAGLFIVTYGLFLSHRIAGPLYRLNKYLLNNKASSKDCPDLTFREGDYFPEIAESMNQFLENPSKKEQ